MPGQGASAGTSRSTTARSPPSTPRSGSVLDALDASAVRDRTLVVLTSDHGESLGEHDYYFDHGENLFDPSMRIPLLVAGPGVDGRAADATSSPRRSTSSRPSSTRSRCPTRRTSRARACCRPRAASGARTAARLHGQNDRNLLGAWDRRFKIVATPVGRRARATPSTTASATPGRPATPRAREPERAREERRELELFRERIDAQLVRTRRLLEGQSGRGAAQPRRRARSSRPWATCSRAARERPSTSRRRSSPRRSSASGPRAGRASSP